MIVLPQTPEELLDELFKIFPKYRGGYDGPIHDGRPTFHSVLIGFTCFFGAHSKSLADEELCLFADLVNNALEAGGALENAFVTCFLEHLRQIRAERVLRPYLSKSAREKTR